MKNEMENLVSLAKRRGFVFQSSEIYGGLSGFWDLGPYGVELANNIKNSWWQSFVYRQPNVVGLDSSIIQNPKLWQASGHVDTFVDPMVDCKSCKHRFRADHVAKIDSSDLKKLATALKGKPCPNCGKKDTLTEPRQFQMMFKTYVGPVELASPAGRDDTNVAYLRPETAGGIFAQFENVRETTRQKVPFGIAQIGKAFRNEITPGDFIFRVREFEQMELEYFVKPAEADREYEKWRKFCWEWLTGIGLKQENLEWHEHAADEKAHYAAASVDIQYKFPFGSKELYGIANRTDFDLKAHAQASGKDLSVFEEGSERYIPYVVEPSVGIGRLMLALMLDAYGEEEVKGERRVVLRLHPDIAPVKVAVLPLSKNEQLTPLAKEVWQSIAGEFKSEYDETQSIGRRYRRQDEIGTPLCVTVDFDSLEDKSVTIRERDTMKQDRVKIADLESVIKQKLESSRSLPRA